MLRAIEDEHFDQLPGGVFNKGFIRAYAKHLGLDEEETINAYLDTLNPVTGHQPGPEKVAPQPRATERRSGPDAGRRRTAGDRRSEARRSSTAHAEELPELQLPKAEHVHPKRKMAVYSDSSGISWRIPVLVAIAIVAGGIWWTRSRNAHADGASPAPPRVAVSARVSAANPVTAANPGTTLLGSTDAKPTTSGSSHRPAHATVKGLSNPGSPNPGSSNPGSPSSSPRSAASLTSSAAQDTKKQDATDEGQDSQPSSPTTDAPVPRPHAKLMLVIRASENSWISVTADGQPVLHETLIAPAHASVSAMREIVVRAGNAAGVTFSMNGQEFPPQGSEGEVRTLVFDSSGMRAAAASAPPADPVR
jgi:cytoskeletal protein RodZ